jgi:hypothetical protein
MAQVAGQGRPVVCCRQTEQGSRHGRRVDAGDRQHRAGTGDDRGGLGADRPFQRVLEHGAGTEQIGVPLPSRVAAVDASVVQLVEHGEGQLQVLVVQDVG